MKRKLACIISLAIMALIACKREDYWNQTNQTDRATILGTLINTDDNTPFKGVKILVERQIDKDGGRAFVDTVSTDEKGVFKYNAPYPNRIRIAVRDTGRYHFDERFLAIDEKKDYPVELKSFPRFGLSRIQVGIADLEKKTLADVNIALFVKGNVDESYSLVETKKTNEQGLAVFQDIAFPVHYKVRIDEDSSLYDLDSLEGRLLTKDPILLNMVTKKKFGKGDILIKSFNYYLGTIVRNEKVLIQYKSIQDVDFQPAKEYVLDQQGQLVLENVTYPGAVRISAPNSANYPFASTEVSVNEDHTVTPRLFTIIDLMPRANELAPSADITANNVESLVDDYGIFTMELDSKQNLWAVTTNNQLIKITPEGRVTVVAGVGGTVMPDGYDPAKQIGDGRSVIFNKLWGIGLVDDNTIYVSENDGVHLIKKVVVDPISGNSIVSIFSGSAKKSGTMDGPVETALYNRPSDLVYSKKEQCLYVSEWAGTRIRKIDLRTNQVSTLATGAGVGYAFGISLSADERTLYIASHTSTAGIKKLDLINNTLTNVIVAPNVASPRHVLISPDNRIFFTENKQTAGESVYTINSAGAKVLVAGKGNSTNGIPAGTMVEANTAIFGSENDPGVAGLAYDPFRGRLYVASASNKKLYFIRLKSLY